MTKVTIDKLSDEVMSVLKEETDARLEEINKRVDQIAAEAVNELKQTSPRSKGSGGKHGHYAEGWAKKNEESNWEGITKKTIYNKAKPQITHLLENGHLKAGGTERVPGIPHIGPVHEKIAEKLNQLGG